MKNYQWIICSENRKDQKFSSLKEAIKYSREEIIGEKNPCKNLCSSFQTNEDFEIVFYDIFKSKEYYNGIFVQIIREDRYYAGRMNAILAGYDEKVILDNMA